MSMTEAVVKGKMGIADMEELVFETLQAVILRNDNSGFESKSESQHSLTGLNSNTGSSPAENSSNSNGNGSSNSSTSNGNGNGLASLAQNLQHLILVDAEAKHGQAKTEQKLLAPADPLPANMTSYSGNSLFCSVARS